MNFILTSGKEVVRIGSQLLNHPTIKEGIKEGLGFVSLAFGALAAYDLCQIFKDRKISVNKVARLAAKVSLVLSAIVSRQGVRITSFLVYTVASKEQLEGVFGPNTIYALNPLHPRHIVSLAAAALAIPLVVLTLFKTINGTSFSEKMATGLSDRRLRLMTFFNFMTSRPVLHLGNSLAG